MARLCKLPCSKGIRPLAAVEIIERNASPLQFIESLSIVVDLDMHDDGAGLLNLADASKLQVIGKAGRDVAGRSVSGQVSGRNAGQKKENKKTSSEDQNHQRRGNGDQAVGHATGKYGVQRLREGLSGAFVACNGVAHLHQYKCQHRDQQESRKSKDESTAHREHGGSQDHKKRKRREQVVITRSLQRKEAHDAEKQDKVDGGRKKGAREKEVVGKVNDDVDQCKETCPALRNREVELLQQQVSADEESESDECDGGKIKASSRGQHDESSEHEEKEGDVEIAFDSPS